MIIMKLYLYCLFLFVLCIVYLVAATHTDSSYVFTKHMLLCSSCTLILTFLELLTILIFDWYSVNKKQIKNFITSNSSNLKILNFGPFNIFNPYLLGLPPIPFTFKFKLGDTEPSSTVPSSSDEDSANNSNTKEAVSQKYKSLNDDHTNRKNQLNAIEAEENESSLYYGDDYVSPARLQVITSWYQHAVATNTVNRSLLKDLKRDNPNPTPADNDSSLLEMFHDAPTHLASLERAELKKLSPQEFNNNSDDNMDVD